MSIMRMLHVWVVITAGRVAFTCLGITLESSVITYIWYSMISFLVILFRYQKTFEFFVYCCLLLSTSRLQYLAPICYRNIFLFRVSSMNKSARCFIVMGLYHILIYTNYRITRRSLKFTSFTIYKIILIALFNMTRQIPLKKPLEVIKDQNSSYCFVFQ